MFMAFRRAFVGMLSHVLQVYDTMFSIRCDRFAHYQGLLSFWVASRGGGWTTSIATYYNFIIIRAATTSWLLVYYYYYYYYIVIVLFIEYSNKRYRYSYEYK